MVEIMKKRKEVPTRRLLPRWWDRQDCGLSSDPGKPPMLRELLDMSVVIYFKEKLPLRLRIGRV
jgi:hypothetical protein